MRSQWFALLLCCLLLAGCQTVKVADEKLAGEKRLALLIRSPDIVHFVRRALIFSEDSSVNRYIENDNTFIRAAMEQTTRRELAARRPGWRIVAVKSVPASIGSDLTGTVGPWIKSTDASVVLTVTAFPASLPYLTDPNARNGDGYGVFAIVGNIWGPQTAPYLSMASALLDPATLEGVSPGAYHQMWTLDTDNQTRWDFYLPYFDPGGPMPDLAPWREEMERLVPIMVKRLFDDLGI